MQREFSPSALASQSGRCPRRHRLETYLELPWIMSSMSALESHPDPPCDYLQETRYAALRVCWMQPLLRLGTVQMFIWFSTTHPLPMPKRAGHRPARRTADPSRGTSISRPTSQDPWRALCLSVHLLRCTNGACYVRAGAADRAYQADYLQRMWQALPPLQGHLCGLPTPGQAMHLRGKEC